MTVKELVEELLKYDLEREVLCRKIGKNHTDVTFIPKKVEPANYLEIQG